jgi:hypothetical protein
MRKLLWCGVAAALCGVMGAGYLAWRHPESLPGRCLHKANEVGLRYGPAGLAARAVSGDRSDEQAAEAACEEPTPCADENEGGDGGERKTTVADKMLTAVLNWRPAEPAPAPIVIHDDEELPVPVDPMARVDDQAVLELLRPLTEELRNGLPEVEGGPCRIDHPCPPVMPYCQDAGPAEGGKPVPEMPYAEEDEVGNDLTFWYEVGFRHDWADGLADDESGWLGLVCKSCAAGVSKHCSDWAAAACPEPGGFFAWWVKVVTPAWKVELPQGGYEQSEPKDEPMPAPDMPKMEDPYGHHHEAYCPYSGCPAPRAYSRCEPLPAADENKDQPKEEEEVRLEKKHHSFFQFLKSLQPMTVQPPSSETPAHPEVDTMEFRPSDFGLNDTIGGPF